MSEAEAEIPITWTHEYSAESSVRHPSRLLTDIAVGAWGGRALARRLFVRNISGSYRQTLMGYLWILIPTVAQIGTWTFLANQQLLKSDQLPGVSFVVFIAVGSLLWQTFFDAIVAPLRAVNANQGLLNRINLPRESLVLVGLAEVLFFFSVRFLLICAMCLAFGISWSPLTAVAPILLGGLLLLGLGIGLFLTPLGVLYQDISRTLAVLSPFWMILTPVVYLAPRTPWYRVWNCINAPAGLLSACRDLLVAGHTDSLPLALIWLGISVPMFLFGLVWFRLGFPIFVERLSN